ncbi:hypothetical protein EU520_00105 [Candidatus Thorarchaeota archaeon]|nr:MAG: hypothetical protein EU520_00105 [Candidatus Thorarchaeota archaeon]
MTSELDRIVFIPVVHTDAESVERVRRTIREREPEVVAVELDRQRYELLQRGGEPNEVVLPGHTGDVVQDLFFQIARLEENLGNLTGSDAGAEMLAAIEEGREIGAKIALVDRPIHETMQAFMKVPLDEVYGFVHALPTAEEDAEEQGVDALLAMLRDESQVEEIVSQFMEEFPHLADALIGQRDRYVANALKTILDDVEGLIVAVLGSGHMKGVKMSLKKMLQEDAGS